MTTRSRLAPALLLTCLLASLAGCSSDPGQGYTLGKLYRDDVETVAVPMWERGEGVYRRELETRLTEALTKQIELDTPYKVVDKSKADTILTGKIVLVDQTVGSFNPRDDRPREQTVRLVAEFTWTDQRTGEILVQRKNFRASAVYYPTEPLGEDFFQGSEDAVNQLAQRIVEQLETPW